MHILNPNDPRAIRRHTHGGARHSGPRSTPANRPTSTQEAHHDADPGGWMPAAPWPTHTRTRGRALPALDAPDDDG